MNQPAIDILMDAKALLMKRGWFKGGMEAFPDGPCCVLAALEAAAGMTAATFSMKGLRNLPVDIAYHTLLEVTGAKPSQLGVWNDDPTRTIQQVFDALDKAALQLAFRG